MYEATELNWTDVLIHLLHW